MPLVTTRGQTPTEEVANMNPIQIPQDWDDRGLITFEEFCETLTWAQLGLHAKPVILANIENYFDKMYDMLDYAVAEKFVTAESRARWRNAGSVTQVMQILAGEGIS